MKLTSVWNGKMKFSAEVGHHTVPMDTKPPLGDDSGISPKQMLLAAICGCTGMDIVSLLKKYKQPLSKLEIEAEASISEGTHPIVFKEVELIFKFEGALELEKVLEAVKLSQTKFCGVSAMLSKAFPISYTVQLNSNTIGTGSAQFQEGTL